MIIKLGNTSVRSRGLRRPALCASSSECKRSAKRREVHPTAALGRGDRETQREVGLAHAGWAEQHHVLLALDEAECVQALDLLALHTRLKTEIEIGERLHRREPGRAHRRLQPARIAQLNVGPEQMLDRLAAGELPGIAAAQSVVQRFQGAGHLEIGELRAQALP
jgi:hypothetical protein